MNKLSSGYKDEENPILILNEISISWGKCNPYHRKMMLLGFFKKDFQLVSPIKANDIPEDRSVTNAIGYTCGPSFHIEN